ncbi:MAG: DUF4339 domain-containing protein [Opitutales bacterium]|nr:DUF4339 domain-containing protein [Opitutales bacterium]MCH8539280.1 DUF4339 domain-containing protein [Opitutales bacterium]
MDKYFIKDTLNAEARGPFSLEDLQSLGENGHIAPESLAYTEEDDSWLEINKRDKLMTAVFPEKKKLRIRPKDEIDTINKESADDQEISVNDLLAAAEGKTKGSKKAQRVMELQEKGAYWGLTFTGSLLLGFSLVMLFPQIDVLLSFHAGEYIVNPFIIMGLLGLAASAIILLQVPEVYPFMRFFVSFAFGFLALYFYSMGESGYILFALLATASMFTLTLIAHLYYVIAVAAVGLFSLVILATNFLTS